MLAYPINLSNIYTIWGTLEVSMGYMGTLFLSYFI
jgi:hypothetical protein